MNERRKHLWQTEQATPAPKPVEKPMKPMPVVTVEVEAVPIEVEFRVNEQPKKKAKK